MKPEPAAAIGQASAMNDAMPRLVNTRISPDSSLTDHAILLGLLHDTARLLADTMAIEGRLTEAALLLPLDGGPATPAPLAAEAGAARAALIHAGRLTDAAAGDLYRSWKEATSRASRADRDPSDRKAVIAHARQASYRAAELLDAVAAAEHRSGNVPALALISGHRLITQTLGLATLGLADRCRRLRQPLADAFSQHTLSGAARAAEPAADAADRLDQASRRALVAYGRLDAAWPFYHGAAKAAGVPS